jgi:hypothetical protein
VYKPSLWKELYEEKRPQKFDAITPEDFDRSSIIYGDINDFIERTWSRERYEAAMSAYDGSVVIHDVARRNSVVHTDYPDIRNAPIEKLLFTHNPDNLTAQRPILTSGKRIVLRKGEVYEWVRGEFHTFDADIYVHHFSSDLIGYESEDGDYKVIEKDGLLGIVEAEDPTEGFMRVDLYQDIGGEYFPILIEPNKCYFVRGDGRVEEVTFDEHSSKGKIVENIRGRIPTK